MIVPEDADDSLEQPVTKYIRLSTSKKCSYNTIKKYL
jgi:hypothetical protein